MKTAADGVTGTAILANYITSLMRICCRRYPNYFIGGHGNNQSYDTYILIFT